MAFNDVTAPIAITAASTRRVNLRVISVLPSRLRGVRRRGADAAVAVEDDELAVRKSRAAAAPRARAQAACA
jgi:hypothetical protein